MSEPSLRALVTTASPKVGGALFWLWDFALRQWFFIALAILIVISRTTPNFGRHGGLIRAEYTIGYGAVILIFLQSGLSIKTKELTKNIRQWRAHLTLQVTCFLVTSAIMFGMCTAIKSAGDHNIDRWVLVGLLVTATCPTNVSSNVVMTRQANGNALLCLCEVVIGNMLGAFISPALLQMYTSAPGWEFANPAAGSSVKQLYANVMQQLGCTVFIPMFVGQVIQNLFPKQTEWFLTTTKFNKVPTLCLLLVMFSSFSTAFYQKAFESMPAVSSIFLVFFDIGMYFFWTGISFLLARPFFISWLFAEEPTEKSTRAYKICYKIFRPFYYNRADTICIMFCGPAKTGSLGMSLISSQYSNDFEYLGRLLASLVLYQALQVINSKFLVSWFRNWEKLDHPEELKKDEESHKEEDDDLRVELDHADVESKKENSAISYSI